MKKLALVALLAVFLFSTTTAMATPTPTSLGKKLFFDKNLSSNRSQSCASCHDPKNGWASPHKDSPVSEGAVRGRFGFRNSPMASYAKFVPARSFDATLGTFVGGLFMDGRVDSLAEQAKGPLLNPLEMNMPSKRSVVSRVAAAKYAGEFKAVYGSRIFDAANTNKAFDKIATAIAAFERSSSLNKFTSKHDYAMTLSGPARMAVFTLQERQGMMLFNGAKAKCSLCHVTPMSSMNMTMPMSNNTTMTMPGMGGGMGMGMGAGMANAMPTGPVLFTDHRYANLGLPKDPGSAFLTAPASINPSGAAFVDHGLAAVLPGGLASNRAFDGMFRTPSLRNVALTAPYGHNGYFKSLKDVVHFYNTRDIPTAGWPAAEVTSTVDTASMGNLGLTDAEEDAIVAFLGTLSDGWWVK